MAGHGTGNLVRAHARPAARVDPAGRRAGAARAVGDQHLYRRDPGRRRGNRTASRSRTTSHLLRARPGPDRALHRGPALPASPVVVYPPTTSGNGNPALEVAQSPPRSPALSSQKSPWPSDRPRPRLRSRARRARQRGRLRRFLPDGSTRHVGRDVVLSGMNLCTRRWTGSATTPGPAPLRYSRGGDRQLGRPNRVLRHDLEDAVHSGIVAADTYPVRWSRSAARRREQLNTFVRAVCARGRAR